MGPVLKMFRSHKCPTWVRTTILVKLTAPSRGRFWQGTWQSREHGKTWMCRKELSHKGWMGPESRGGKICGIMWTGEKVLDGFRNIRAKGAVRGRGSINGMKVTLEFRTVARTELGKDSSVMPVKG